MSDERTMRSVLLADIGTALTHVALIEPVEGLYRLIARAERPTTLAGAERDVTLGLERAIGRLEDIVQRQLLDRQGLIQPEQENGTGVDLVVATCSAAPPLRVAIVGITEDMSVASARRACAGAPATVELEIVLDTRFRNWDEEALNGLYSQPPEVIVLVGGSDSGPTEPLESAASVLTTVYELTPVDERPVVVYAGNQEARRALADLMGPVFDLRVVDNVRPNPEVESLGELERELNLLYEQLALPQVPGFQRLSSWTGSPVRATLETLSATLRFMAQQLHLGQGLLAVDVGGLTTHAAAASGSLYQWTTCAEIGSTYGIGNVLRRVGIERLIRWLPEPVDPEQVVARLRNIRLRPHTVAQSKADLLLLHAVLREALGMAVDQMDEQHWSHSPSGRQPTPAFDLIAARGGSLAHTPYDSLVTLTLLDALQPVGLSRLVIDWASIWPQIGALAHVMPLAALQVLTHDALRDLATVIAPRGRGRPGEVAVRLTLRHKEGAPTEHIARYGEVIRIPLGDEDEVEVEAKPGKRFDLGFDRPGVGARTTVRGGGLGIVVDARGRPLSLPSDDRERRAQLIAWLSSLENVANGSA